MGATVNYTKLVISIKNQTLISTHIIIIIIIIIIITNF